MRRIYLDHNATTPLHPEALEAMLPLLREQFGNPSSVHRYGQDALRGMDRARGEVAALIGAEPAEIVFTSGGTESDNLALLGVVGAFGRAAPHIVTSAVEHPAVLRTVEALQRAGAGVTHVAVDARGRVDADAVAAAITEETALVSVMLAQNDVGTLQPVEAIAAAARARGVLIHCDAVQAVGRVDVDVRRLGVDLLSLSGHKIYGPKGSGALFVRRGVKLAPLLHGGEQELGRRAGTPNVPAIVGLGRACALAAAELDSAPSRVATLRDRLESALRADLPGSRINGHPTLRLPNTTSVSCDGVDGEALQMNLDLLGVAVSLGSACSSGTQQPSPVLLAMGLSREQARSTIRISLGRDTTAEEVDAAVAALLAIVPRLRGAS